MDAIQERLGKILTSPSTFTSTLVVILTDAYGLGRSPDDPEAEDGGWTSWDPETLLMEIRDDFGVMLPQTTFDRIMMGRTILTQDTPWHNAPDFIDMCNVLSGDCFDPRTWDPATSLEIAWGITELVMLDPPDDPATVETELFSDQVIGYIAHVLDMEGIINPPDILRFAVGDDDKLTEVQAEFSDDPVMFGSIWEAERAKTDFINSAVTNALHALAQQLKDLPLRTGHAQGVVQGMLRLLGEEAAKADSTDTETGQYITGF